ncbi:MAG: hypothetical protein K8G79_05650 [bacterium]|uniref:Uncharacterized protein n=1 Tax=Candidatus Methylomirabilis tolerans TaxID=3123416 RepID=A0AAJ1AHN5_9BACT|nr:hypothetical protein [Candidatus Methylomirabilis sp.]
MNNLFRPAVETKRNWSNLPVVFPLLIYAFGVALAFVSRTNFEGDLWLIVVHLAAAAALYYLWSRGQWGEARFESFGAVALLAGLFYRLIGIVDILSYGSRFDEWPTSVSSSEAWWDIIRGEALTQVSLILVVFSWHWSIGRHAVRTSFLAASKQQGKAYWIVWALYVLAMTLEITKQRFNLEYGSANQVIGVFYLSGVAATLVIANTRPGNKSRILWAAGLGLPLSLMAIGSSMKQNIIIPLLPAGILLWLASKKLGAKLAILTAAILFTAYLQAYVSFARPIR